MINLFASCGDIASVGIIVDFAEDIETYVVGTPVDIKNWAYNGCPKKATDRISLHKNKAGNLIKDIKRLMKVKYELDEIVDFRDKLCNADMLCDGSCNSVLDEFSQFYDYSEYANIAKNYIIYFLYSKFKMRQRKFNKKSGCPLRATTIEQKNILNCSKQTVRKFSIHSYLQEPKNRLA